MSLSIRLHQDQRAAGAIERNFVASQLIAIENPAGIRLHDRVTAMHALVVSPTAVSKKFLTSRSLSEQSGLRNKIDHTLVLNSRQDM
ncbi:hypothetical protein [Mesorhizobium sp.]|uniref:hypothetical protein n=1 Tax=Mesorhizobium sp. TaxID=1871066 RepID=UPI00257B76AA|nr:hypothetical protein [Mesorhizobium sp.]